MKFFSTIFVLFIAFFSTNAFAGAWTQPENGGIMIASTSAYFADNYYDNDGHKHSQRSYAEAELDPYMEYGLWDGITLGGNISLQTARQGGAFGTDHAEYASYGVGDSEIFLRARLWEQDGFALSAQPLFKFPSPAPSSLRPRIGSSTPDAAMGLSAGYGFDLFGEHHFADLDTQYRYRFGAPQDQVRLYGTLGVALDERWMLMPQFFLTYRTNTPRITQFTESSGDDYDLNRLQFSVLYELHKGTRIQLGGFSDVSGKNTGAGEGVILALWQTL